MVPDRDSGAHSELASFGEELRREREIRGISLREIADATKVSRRFLEALENNDHRTLPAPVFTRGFVREYARYLGLNAEEMVNRYNVAAAGDDRIEKSAHLDGLVHPMPAQEAARAAVRGRERRDIPSVVFRIDGAFFVLLVVAAMLAGVTWWALRHKQTLLLRARAETAAVPGARRPAAAPAPVPVVAAAATAAPATSTAGTTGSLQLTAYFTGDSWVSLEVDGQSVLSDEVRQGERRTWTAASELRFRTIGNAGGIELTLNGVRLPDLGPEGKVLRDVVITRETLTHPETIAPVDDRTTP